MSERHLNDRPITTLEEALGYIEPHPLNNGTIVFQVRKLRQASSIIRLQLSASRLREAMTLRDDDE